MATEHEDDFTDDTSSDGRLARVEQELAKSALRADYGLSGQQAEAVHKLIAGSGLDATEAIGVARSRHPDLFPTRAKGAEYGSLTPGRGGHAQPQSDWKQRLEVTNKLRATNKLAHNAMFNNMVGAKLARVIGWDHKMLDLPQG